MIPINKRFHTVDSTDMIQQFTTAAIVPMKTSKQSGQHGEIKSTGTIECCLRLYAPKSILTNEDRDLRRVKIKGRNSVLLSNCYLKVLNIT